MNIQDALKETGKVKRKGWGRNEWLAITDLSSSGDIQFFFYVKEISVHGERYSQTNILDNEWQPYHDKKEIRPENAGELWEHDETEGYFHTDYSTQDAQLVMIGYKGVSRDAEITHGDHWTRLHPPVEDDSVEKVEFKRVFFDRIKGKNGANYMSIISTSGDSPSIDMLKGREVDVTLKIPKDKS